MSSLGELMRGDLGHRAIPVPAPMIDPFGRAITYLRVSVTDRCDFRCVYCMAENMTFLPKADLLSPRGARPAVLAPSSRKGVRKLRLTGGEPLVRRGIMTLVASLSRHLGSGALDELTLTTNGSQLAKYAAELAGHGVKRINVSLDTLDPDKFRAITRWGELDKVLAGIAAAQAAGLAVKINAVALKGVNEDEFGVLVAWAHGARHGPHHHRGDAARRCRRGRLEQYLPLSLVRARLARALHPRRDRLPHRRAGALRARSRRPADGSASSPRSPTISANPATGCASPAPARCYMCLGQEDAADLRTPLRASPDDELLARRHRRGDLAQAQGPRFHHRPPPPAPGAGPPHERDRRADAYGARRARTQPLKSRSAQFAN